MLHTLKSKLAKHHSLILKIKLEGLGEKNLARGKSPLLIKTKNKFFSDA